MRIIVAGALLLCAIPAAEAASFDCAKASTPVEHAICDNAELGRRDEVLAKAYATAIGGLGDDARSIVQASQREWLDFAALACTPDARPFTAALNDTQVQCVAALYRNRIEVLGQSRMEGDWRVYPYSSYSLVDDPDPEAFQGVATTEVISPRLDEDSEAAAPFNEMMADADLQEQRDPDAEDYSSADVSVSTTIVGTTPRRISVSTNSWWYGHGAAHGNYSVTFQHYLVEQERMLVAADLFVGDAWQAPLGELALAELDRTIEGGIWDEARADVPTAAADPSRWNLTSEGLEITFQPYEVAAYAVGAPTVTIGWDKLQDWLTEGYAELLY